MTVPPAISSRHNIGDLHNTDGARAIPTLRPTSSVDNSYLLQDCNGSSNSIHQNAHPTIYDADYRYDHYSTNANSTSVTNRRTAHTHHNPRAIHYAPIRSIPYTPCQIVLQAFMRIINLPQSISFRPIVTVNIVPLFLQLKIIILQLIIIIITLVLLLV